MLRWVSFAVAFAGCTTLAPPPDGPDPSTAARKGDHLRLVSWNIESVGQSGDAEYDAALEVLARLDADIVALQEIADFADQVNLASLAADAGYPELAVATPAFGLDRVAFLSRRALLDVDILDSATLSGDPAAADIARNFLRVEVETLGDPLVVVTGHWKCCGGDTSEFRRAVESLRAADAIAPYDPATDAIVVVGDFNENPDDLPLSPSDFTTLPTDLPASYWLGDDLYDQLVTTGIHNNPLAPLVDAGLEGLRLTQRDGADDTYLAGGTLDLAFVSDGLYVAGTEIFDDLDEALPSALHLTTAPIPAGTLAAASDHHPLVLELAVRR